MARTLSEWTNWVPYASGLRVGLLISSVPVLSADRIDSGGKLQPPTRKPDAWGTLGFYRFGELEQWNPLVDGRRQVERKK